MLPKIHHSSNTQTTPPSTVVDATSLTSKPTSHQTSPGLSHTSTATHSNSTWQKPTTWQKKPKQSHTDNDTHIRIHDTNINQVHETTFLGVTIDDKLSFRTHIKQTENKISKGLYALRSVKHILPKRHLKLIYHALISSHLSYGIIFWHTAAKTHLHRLNVLQKKALRTITNSEYNAPSAPLFKNELILPLDNMYSLELQKLMYKINRNLLPTSTPTAFTTNAPTHTYSTRHRESNPMPTRYNTHHLAQVAHKSFV